MDQSCRDNCSFEWDISLVVIAQISLNNAPSVRVNSMGVNQREKKSLRTQPLIDGNLGHQGTT
uniref:Uncharacterized protein n=1 Tax=Arundo donax TaxID=35708 RepID=A0A0A9CLT1_ARUDO